MSSIYDLSECLRHKVLGSRPDKTDSIDIDKLYDSPSLVDGSKDRPWQKNPTYFKKTHLSALALMKMAIHASSGGSIEIMGMLTGKVANKAIIVMDVYPLPVEGTETRVNAQAEGYEYMVQYLERLKEVGRDEHIVGWYHSHPGYGCWLSGIDVATQRLNQNFQDPYLAIVVDPLRTKSQGIVEIGAFRTYPDDFKHEGSRKDTPTTKLPAEKQQDFGAHCESYYALDISIYQSAQDKLVTNLLSHETWISGLTARENAWMHNYLESVLALVAKLKSCATGAGTPLVEMLYLKKFEKVFEDEMLSKLLVQRLPGPGLSQMRLERNLNDRSDAQSDTDESDLEEETDGGALNVSDVDDVASMESSTVAARQKRTDFDNDEDDFEEDANASTKLAGIEYLRRHKKLQRRKPATESNARLALTQQHPQRPATPRRQNVTLSSFGEHEMKQSKNSKDAREIQVAGNKIAMASLQFLLTSNARHRVFGQFATAEK